MFRIVLSIVLCVALSTLMAGAGYTDELWNESEDREYYDCGDWSGVNNYKHLGLVRYGDDYADPKTIPVEVWFRSATNPTPAKSDDIGWMFLHVQGFDKHLWHNGTIYTDEPRNINYLQGYQDRGKLDREYWNSQWAYSGVYAVYREGEYTQGTFLSIKYKRVVSYSCGVGGLKTCHRDEYDTPTDRLSETLYYRLWGEIDPDMSIELESRPTYCILTVPTPANITGIRITANGSTYEKYSHCLKTNNTTGGFQYYDLIECDYCAFSGIFPYGEDRYLIDAVPSANISVTLFTPFEAHNATIKYTIIECSTDEPLHIKNHSIYALIRFLLPTVLIIWLYRRF